MQYANSEFNLITQPISRSLLSYEVKTSRLPLQGSKHVFSAILCQNKRQPSTMTSPGTTADRSASAEFMQRTNGLIQHE